MTSLGSVFFQAGEEAARTKLGCGDSFSSPPALNALDWERMYQYEDLIQYYKGMLKLRKEMPVYWKREMKALKQFTFYETQPECVAFSVDASDAENPWKRLWVIYAKPEEGCEEEQRTLQLPKARRVLISDGRTVCEHPSRVTEGEDVTVVCSAVTVFGEPAEGLEE